MQRQYIMKGFVKILVGTFLFHTIPINLTFDDSHISNILKVNAANTSIDTSADITWGDTYQEPDGIDGLNYVGNYASLGGNGEKTALKFDLSSLVGAVITKAELKLTVKARNGDPYVNIYKSSDDTWTGNDTTLPSNTGDIILNQVPVGAAADISFDITNYIKEEYSLDQVATVILSGKDTGANVIAFGAMGNSYSYTIASLYVEYSIPTPLTQVTGVALSDIGVATWTDVANESGYSVQLFKNGSSAGAAITKSADEISHDFLNDIRNAGVGAYTVTVTAKGDGITYSDGPASDASSSKTVTKLATISSGLTWSADAAYWDSVLAVSYDVQLYKDQNAVGTAKNILEANVASGTDFSSEMVSNGGGIYTYKVTPKGDSKFVLDGKKSASSNNNIKAIQLSQVTDAALSASGAATWTNVTNATSYEVQLYKDGSEQGTAVTKTDGTIGHDFLSAMRSAGAGVYTVKVTAKGDGIYYSDSLQSAASSGQTVIKLATAGGLTWVGDIAKFNGVSDAVNYVIQLYKNGTAIGSAKTLTSANTSLGTDFSSEITAAGVGRYTFNVTAKGDTNLILDSETAGASKENINSTQLVQVTGVMFSDSGVASWSDVDNETNYSVQLYKDGAAYGIVSLKGTNTLSHDFLSDMRAAGAGVYKVSVMAKGDGALYLDGVVSLFSSSQTITKLTTVNNGLTWSNTLAKWTPVNNAVSYQVQLYKNGSASGTPVSVAAGKADNGVDFSAAITSGGMGTYTYKVTAIGNTTLILDAGQSSFSNEYVKKVERIKVTFDKNESSKKNKKISVDLSFDTNCLTSIKNGKNKLKMGVDYTVKGNTVTISKNYLETLGVGSAILTISFDNGEKQTITITVADTTKDIKEASSTNSSTSLTTANKAATASGTTAKASKTFKAAAKAASSEKSNKENNTQKTLEEGKKETDTATITEEETNTDSKQEENTKDSEQTLEEKSAGNESIPESEEKQNSKKSLGVLILVIGIGSLAGVSCYVIFLKRRKQKIKKNYKYKHIKD